MAKKTEKRSWDHWKKVVAEYERMAEEEAQEAFARRKQLNVGTFRYWLYKLREANDDQPVRFVEVTASEVTSARGDVEVELGAGRCTVRFGRDADASWIGEVVAVLAVRLEC